MSLGIGIIGFQQFSLQCVFHAVPPEFSCAVTLMLRQVPGQLQGFRLFSPGQKESENQIGHKGQTAGDHNIGKLCQGVIHILNAGDLGG